VLMLAASCEELRARTGNPPLGSEISALIMLISYYFADFKSSFKHYSLKCLICTFC
jgi:hypothetical protein